MRKCPYCAELIPAESRRCRYCWSKVTPQAAPASGGRLPGRDAQAQYRPVLPQIPAAVARPGDPRFGAVMILLGLAVTLFFAVLYDTSAGAPRPSNNPLVVGNIEVHDATRLQNRRIGIILGLGLLLVGLAVGLPRSAELTDAPPQESRPIPAGRPDWRSQADPRYLPEDRRAP